MSTPLLLAIAAGIAGFFWWKRRNGGSKEEKKETRSPFKFPQNSSVSAKKEPIAASNLPRNKKSSKKKSKAQKRAEKARKAEKRKTGEPKASKDSGGPEGSSSGGQASTAVINYSYFDSARRDTVLPTQKRPKLSAADIMKKDQEALQKANQSEK